MMVLSSVIDIDECEREASEKIMTPSFLSYF